MVYFFLLFFVTAAVCFSVQCVFVDHAQGPFFAWVNVAGSVTVERWRFPTFRVTILSRLRV